MAYKPVGVDEQSKFPERVQAALNATYVTYVDSVTGLPLVGKHVQITVDTTADEIVDLLVEDI